MDVARDEEGYLVEPDDWTEEIAIQLAAEESLTLDNDYWAIIKIMREHYVEHLVAPDVRHVTAALARDHGFDKAAAKKHLFNLFPYGYVKQACKIAGMKRPRAWSTG